MTYIEFATNDRRRAERYLRHEQMNYLSAETREYILAGVEAGVCRVRDPLMYGGSSGIVPETTDREAWDTWSSRLKELHDDDRRTRPRTFVLSPGDLPDGYEVEWGTEIGGDHIFWRGTTHEVLGMGYCMVQSQEDGRRLFRRIIGPSIEVDPHTGKDIVQ